LFYSVFEFKFKIKDKFKFKKCEITIEFKFNIGYIIFVESAYTGRKWADTAGSEMKWCIFPK